MDEAFLLTLVVKYFPDENMYIFSGNHLNQHFHNFIFSIFSYTPSSALTLCTLGKTWSACVNL